MKKHANSAIAISVVTILLVSGIGPTDAGILPLNVKGVNAAATSNSIDVRYRRGGAAAAGIAFGLLGSAIASQYYSYPPYYYYGPYRPFAPYAPPIYYYPPYTYYGPYVGRPYVGYRAYPRYRYYGVRHHRPRHRVHR